MTIMCHASPLLFWFFLQPRFRIRIHCICLTFSSRITFWFVCFAEFYYSMASVTIIKGLLVFDFLFPDRFSLCICSSWIFFVDNSLNCMCNVAIISHAIYLYTSFYIILDIWHNLFVCYMVWCHQLYICVHVLFFYESLTTFL